MKISSFIKKSTNYIKSTKKDYLYSKKHFSDEIAKISLKCDIGNLLHIKNNLNEIKEKLIYEYLRNKYNYLIEKYNKKSNDIRKINKKYIWVLWYQGIEQAPELVKKCIKSIKKNSYNYEVIILTKDNISKYIDIPDIILNKVDNKIITLTHFSDILRMGLLSKYGGIWVDSTCYITSNVFTKFDNVIFNSNSTNKENKWCGFFIGGQPNKIFEFSYEFLLEYNSTEDRLIDYFLVDYILKICYLDIEGCKKLIDCQNIYNENIYMFEKKFNYQYEKGIYDKIINSSDFFKLTYKKDFKKKVKNKLTNYGYFIKTTK